MKEKKKTDGTKKVDKVTTETVNKNETKEGEKKLNFFKKIWYSIGKVSKYDEMIDLGLKTSIKYFFGLLAIVSLILAIIAIGIEIFILGTDASYIITGFIVYFLAYYIILFINFALIILIFAIYMLFMIKLLKLKYTFKKSLSIIIYSLTLSVIIYDIYLIISYFTGFVIPYFTAITIIIVYVYTWIILYRKREEWGNGFYRRSKKKSKK